MVEGFVGLPGSGKTYWLSRLGLRAMKQKRKVYANYKLEGAVYYKDLKEVLDVREGVILVDEINLICPARWWDRFPTYLAYWWSQTRKSQLDVYWTAQHQDRVDKIIREITNWIWEVHFLPFRFRFMNCFLPEQISKVRRRSFGFHLFFLHSGIWKHFNTFERVDIPARISKQSFYPMRKTYASNKNFWRKPKVFAKRMSEADRLYALNPSLTEKDQVV